MISKAALEQAWNEWEKEVKELEPSSSERRKVLARISEMWTELALISERLEQPPSIKDPSQRYFGLDPLKISALNIAQNIEADEVNLLSLYFQVTHNLILTNILRLRLLPDSSKRFQTLFAAHEIAGFTRAKQQLNFEEYELWKTRTRLQQEISVLREGYGQFLFVESSYEAARSFGAPKPDIQNHRSSWIAFSQLLTGMAVQTHEEYRDILLKRSHAIEARRESLFESCAKILEKAPNKDAKKIQRQIRQNLAELKKLEIEIESTLSELSGPSVGDSTSFVVKKNPDQATTFQPVKISQSTGDKT